MTCGHGEPDGFDHVLDPSTPGRGKPREQYERTYILLHQTADDSWAKAVIDATWNRNRFTLGSSADDAGVGDLDYRRVVIVNAHLWGTNPRIGAWFDQWYEGVEIIYVNADTPDQLKGKLDDLFGVRPVTPIESFPIIGTHDQAGAEWMVANGVRGWCVIPMYLGEHAQAIAGLERYRDAGINIILRLNYSWAVDDGGQGTMPGPDKINLFEQAVVKTVEMNPTAWGFIYCNEMNNKREHPKNYELTPDYYAASYSVVYPNVPISAKFAPGSVDPYNPGWGDWRVSYRRVLDSIPGADFLSFHCYTHGWALPLIWHDKRFSDDPLKGVHYDLRVLEDQQNILPSRFASLPQVVTETNPDADGVYGWPDSGDWIHEACKYFRERGIAGACLFRYNYDKWRYGDKPKVLEAVREESAKVTGVGQ